jgi:hypothetical protein
MSADSERADHRPARRRRDPRLDVFRGLGMFIIFVAHVPWNSWTDWIPARFGFSDAADMFVFCSGMASAIAFGAVFEVHGWPMGAARIAHRVWQVYWAHIGSFLAVMALMIAADQALGMDHYVREELNLASFFEHPRTHLLGLVTLTYVPNYFDILPMYLAILAMVPAVMALARVSKGLAAMCVVATWTAAQFGLNFTADPMTGRPWFFDPFGWQLVFFTGFAFAKGWLPPPPRDLWLVAVAVLAVVLAAPFSCQHDFACHAGFGAFPVLGEVHDALGPWIDKVTLGPLRYLHFMATAYLAFVAVGVGGSRLRGPLSDMLQSVGRQTLAVFLAGLVASQLMGILLDVIGRGPIRTALANLLGFAILFAAATLVGWFKSQPWRKAPVPPRPGADERYPAPVRSVAAAALGERVPAPQPRS